MSWKKALRFTECCTVAAAFVGMAVFEDHHLSMALVLSGSITYMLSRAVK